MGPATATAATPPAGYSVTGSPTATEALVAGNNPPLVIFVQPEETETGCGRVLAEIVLSGTNTVIPGGSVSEGGVTHTTYPSPLFSCQQPGPVTVTAVAPAGYEPTGPAVTPATIVSGQVAP